MLCILISRFWIIIFWKFILLLHRKSFLVPLCPGGIKFSARLMYGPDPQNCLLVSQLKTIKTIPTVEVRLNKTFQVLSLICVSLLTHMLYPLWHEFFPQGPDYTNSIISKWFLCVVHCQEQSPFVIRLHFNPIFFCNWRCPLSHFFHSQFACSMSPKFESFFLIFWEKS